jgi:hypothetical protein
VCSRMASAVESFGGMVAVSELAVPNGLSRFRFGGGDSTG